MYADKETGTNVGQGNHGLMGSSKYFLPVHRHDFLKILQLKKNSQIKAKYQLRIAPGSQLFGVSVPQLLPYLSLKKAIKLDCASKTQAANARVAGEICYEGGRSA